jgi:hypothetical protein
MVAKMSGHNSDYIMRKMPYARGLQFRTAWYQSKGVKLAEKRPPGLNTVI